MVQTLDAYYSGECVDKCYGGHAIYRKQNGQLVAVTEVTGEGRGPGSIWEDLKFVGKVTEFVESHLSASEEEFFNEMERDMEEEYVQQ